MKINLLFFSFCELFANTLSNIVKVVIPLESCCCLKRAYLYMLVFFCLQGFRYAWWPWMAKESMLVRSKESRYAMAKESMYVISYKHIKVISDEI